MSNNEGVATITFTVPDGFMAGLNLPAADGFTVVFYTGFEDEGNELSVSTNIEIRPDL